MKSKSVGNTVENNQQVILVVKSNVKAGPPIHVVPTDD